MIRLLVSIILYFVIFFGLAFILNMLLRRTWFMSFVYPVVIIIVISKVNIFKYFVSPQEAFSTAFANVMNITLVDWIILCSGLVGTIVSGFVVRFLRKSGYQMF